MIVWILLSLALPQLLMGQEVPNQPKIIRTAPIVIPCMECLKSSGRNLASLLRPSGCGCAEAGYQREDPWTCQPSGQADSQIETEDEADCCCCCNAGDNHSNNEGPSFNAAMLGPIASVLTSFMGGLRSREQAVTVDFDDNPCIDGPSGELAPDTSPSNVLLCDNAESNHSISNLPSSSPVKLETDDGGARPWYPVAEKPLTFGSCQCYRKPRKGVSDVEEDSLYTFAQNSPETKCTCNLYANQETTFNQDFPRNRYSPDLRANEHHEQTIINTGPDQPSVQKDNNLIRPSSTGNPEFDSISKLSALFSSQKNNLNVPTTNQEQNLMPCQCYC